MVPRRDLHWLSLAVFTAGLFSVSPIGILAQTSTAVCLPQFGWMNNTKGQNPCLVAAYLQGACQNGQFSIDPLPPDYYYVGPYKDELNGCQCSSVTYNILSACGYCQNRTYINWSVWDVNCTTIYPGIFLPGIPVGTVVPHWAFQDVTESDRFNITLAQLIGDTPESTAILTHSTAFSSPTLMHIPSTASTATPSPTGNSLNVGAITGGVVGGVVGVALIAGVVVFLLLRRRPDIRPSEPGSARTSAAPLSAVFSDTTLLGATMPQPKLYDPSDPSTFPATPFQPPVMSSPYDHPTDTNPSFHPGGYYRS